MPSVHGRVRATSLETTSRLWAIDASRFTARDLPVCRCDNEGCNAQLCSWCMEQADGAHVRNCTNCGHNVCHGCKDTMLECDQCGDVSCQKCAAGWTDASRLTTPECASCCAKLQVRSDRPMCSAFPCAEKAESLSLALAPGGMLVPRVLCCQRPPFPCAQRQ